jgi:hypothetical protein
MNYLLDPSAGGGAVFPAAIVDDLVWRWHETQDKDGKVKKWVARPVYDEKGNRKKNEAGQFVHKPVDPLKLFIVLGCDQAISDREDSDEWSVAAHGTDTDGIEYILQTLHGHGIEQMLDALLGANEQWKPRVIGLEKAGFQGATKKWIESDGRYKALRGKVVDVSHNNVQKEIRLQNGVAEPMKSRRFFTAADDPGCIDGREQAKDFKPYVKSRRDDILDSWAIASATAHKPANREDISKTTARLDAAYKARRDPDTGIYIGW